MTRLMSALSLTTPVKSTPVSPHTFPADQATPVKFLRLDSVDARRCLHLETTRSSPGPTGGETELHRNQHMTPSLLSGLRDQRLSCVSSEDSPSTSPISVLDTINRTPDMLRCESGARLQNLSTWQSSSSSSSPTEEIADHPRIPLPSQPDNGPRFIWKRSFPNPGASSDQGEGTTSAFIRRCKMPRSRAVEVENKDSIDNFDEVLMGEQLGKTRHIVRGVIEEEDNGEISSPATPSSGFIDVETDETPSSPLNLTTSDGEGHLSHDVTADLSDAPEPTRGSSRSDGSSLDDLNRSPVRPGESQSMKLFHAQKSRAQSFDVVPEKKTNFSIDAILQPDFGAATKLADQEASSFQKHLHHNPPHTHTYPTCYVRAALKSCHSAFSAVDLSTRSRSDSLSSPSCSSSSPSPPLSNSSPSPRLKHEFPYSNHYEQHLYGPDQLFGQQRLFSDSNPEFENMVSKHIPLMNPLYSNNLASFSFMYSPPNGLYHRRPSEADSLKQPHLQTHPPREASLDVTKPISHPFYPFTKSQVPKLEGLKLPVQCSTPIKLKDSTLQALQQNKQDRLSSSSSVPFRKTTTSKPVAASRCTEDKSGLTGPAQALKEERNKCTGSRTDSKLVKPGQREDSTARSQEKAETGNSVWPAWVFCTRYSDRPSSGPRSRKPKRCKSQDEKRPRTAFTNEQLVRLKREFDDCRYLTEPRRKSLADELGLTESQIKIWFQNKRAKIKKSIGVRNPLALQLMEQGLYNHSTVRASDDSS